MNILLVRLDEIPNNEFCRFQVLLRSLTRPIEIVSKSRNVYAMHGNCGMSCVIETASVHKIKGAFFYPQFWNKNGWYRMLGIIRIVCIKKRPSRCAVLVLPFSCTKHH